MGQRFRASVRRLRETRSFGPAVRIADRVWWFRAIRRSSLVDRNYYAAQLGLSNLPRGMAIAHYVAWGFRRGMSLNPLFDDVVAGAELPEVLRVPALYAYLVSERETVRVHPWWDAVERSRSVGAPGLESAWSDPAAEIDVSVGRHSKRMTVSDLRTLAVAAARTWRQHRTAALSRPTSSTTVIAPLQAHDRRYIRKFEQAVRLADRSDVVVPLVGVDASQWISALVARNVAPGVTLLGFDRRARWSDVVGRALDGSHADTAVVLDARAEFTDAEVQTLQDAARPGVAVIPAHRAQDGTLQGIGAADIGGRRAWGILEDHPVEDITGLDESVSVPLLRGRTVAAPVEVLRSAARRTSTQSATDLSRHFPPTLPRRVLTRLQPVLDEPEVAFHKGRQASPQRDGDREVARRIVEEAGFEIVSWEGAPGRPDAPMLRWRRPHPGAQRWALKICAPAGRQGAVWGDAHFAKGLASALRRRGHTVVVDAYDARVRPTAYLDDVNVAIRGPYRIDPPESGVNIQWIISHPDEVTRAEIARFDRVFAASESWSRSTSRRWNVEVEPLLECTDTDLFYPRGVARTDDIVFVGTARGIPRPSVIAPLAAGIPVRVYGPDWRPFISQSALAARSIPHDALPARYESASIVLNDQWPAMRKHGFMAMRPFDVVAVGGRVISEEVEGIDTVFRGAVVTYRDTAHLIDLLRADPDTIFPDAEDLARASERIRREHSFDARARVLDEAARDLLTALSPRG